MSVRRVSLRHVVLHLSGAAFVGAMAWALGIGREDAGVVLVVVGVLVAASWMIFGTLRWLIEVFFRRNDSK